MRAGIRDPWCGIRDPVCAIDIDRDGDIDVVTGGKTAVFLAENLSIH